MDQMSGQIEKITDSFFVTLPLSRAKIILQAAINHSLAELERLCSEDSSADEDKVADLAMAIVGLMRARNGLK